MTYTFRIEEMTIVDDDNVDIEVIEEIVGLKFIDALKELEEFVTQHPYGDLNDLGGYSVCYATPGSELEAIIEMEE